MRTQTFRLPTKLLIAAVDEDIPSETGPPRLVTENGNIAHDCDHTLKELVIPGYATPSATGAAACRADGEFPTDR